MGGISIGCQTYTWQMSGTKYLDQLPHIIALRRKRASPVWSRKRSFSAPCGNLNA